MFPIYNFTDMAYYIVMETLPRLSEEDLDRVASLMDEEIDCSDIPEIKDLSGLRSRPEKVAFTCNLDADIAAWLKQGGYQASLNSILRQLMTRTSLR
jgi:uncharacterized protein (DUF4415 family)